MPKETILDLNKLADEVVKLASDKLSSLQTSDSPSGAKVTIFSEDTGKLSSFANIEYFSPDKPYIYLEDAIKVIREPQQHGDAYIPNPSIIEIDDAIDRLYGIAKVDPGYFPDEDEEFVKEVIFPEHDIDEMEDILYGPKLTLWYANGGSTEVRENLISGITRIGENLYAIDIYDRSHCITNCTFEVTNHENDDLTYLINKYYKK